MRLFGLAGRRASDRQEDASVGGDVRPTTGQDGRADLLEEICTFLLGNNLAITPRNLLIAHDIYSGSNLSLARKVMARKLANAPIDQQWLDAAVSDCGDPTDAQAEFDTFVARFETSLSRFSDTARQAGEATSDYTVALEQTALNIEARTIAADEIAALAMMNRAMLERTRQLEQSMKESRAEAEQLRRNLAAARRDAEVDHLTGLANRRAFERVYENEYRAARGALEDLTVAFCDIDHFKRINDTHGHEAGDRVIQAVAEALGRIVGGEDHCHVARHGGEEFVLLFRGVSTSEALARIDRCRAAFAERNLVNRDTDETIGHVTFSGGVADVFAAGDQRAALKAADNALYAAKEGGRNRIVLAGSTG